MTTALIWIAGVLVLSALCYREHILENREQKQKWGMTRSEFKRYRKMMSSSEYRQKKSPAFTELLQSIHHN